MCWEQMKKMKKTDKENIVIIGDFAEGEPLYSGQTAKVRDYYYYINKKFHDKTVKQVDTRYWKRSIIKVIYSNKRR